MNKTIVALDFSNKSEVMEFLKPFKEPIFVKVGMELFYSCGNEIIKDIKKLGHNIFLDLKLHDIPNTVKAGLKNLALLDVDMINVHCSGGFEMISQGLSGLKEASIKMDKKRPLYIGVTQLTSTSKEMMNEEQGIDGEVIESVIRFAKIGKKAGLDGVVCSVHEVSDIHKACGKEFLTVTPGIRLLQDNCDDQKRIATPELAKSEGSDFIVVGRSITRSDKPFETYNYIENIMK